MTAAGSDSEGPDARVQGTRVMSSEARSSDAPTTGGRPPAGLRLPGTRREWFATGIAVAAIYLAVGAVCILLLDRLVPSELAPVAPSIALPWLPTGFAAAAILVYGPRIAPAVFVGCAVLWATVQGGGLAPAVIDALGEMLSLVIAAALLRSWGYRLTLERYRDVLLLFLALGLGRLLSVALDAAAGVVAAYTVSDPGQLAVLAAAGVTRHGSGFSIEPALWNFLARWWANAVAGGMLVVPLLTLLSPARAVRVRGTPLELVCLVLVLAAGFGVAYVLPPQALRSVLLLGALLPIVWAAARFGTSSASVVTLVVASGATVGFGFQLGAFAGVGVRAGLAETWGFIGLLVGTALFITALLAQREIARQAIATSVERYRRLFLGNPYPMWVEDAASGRLLVVNPAASRIYGFDEAAFLALSVGDLVVSTGLAPLPESEGAPRALSTERHRTASGGEIDVEVPRVPVALEGGRGVVCFIDPLTERNELRLSVLAAGDLERFRLGSAIDNDLRPLLVRIAERARALGGAEADGSSTGRALDAIAADLADASRACSTITRGVSPLQWAGGDLVEALRRLPLSLADPAQTVQFTVRATAPLQLGQSQCDHIYRLVEEAVRSATVFRHGRNVRVTLDVTAERVAIRVEDDGATLPRRRRDDLPKRSIAARAAAAGGRVEVVPAPDGGTAVSFECAQTGPVEPRPAAPIAPPLTAVRSAPPASPVVQPSDRRSWWLQALLLVAAYSATAALSVWVLLAVHTTDANFYSVLALPWIPAGVGVVALLLCGVRLWPAIWVAALLRFGVIGHDVWISVVVDACAQTFAAVLTVRLLERFGFRRSCDRLQDVLVLAAAGGLGLLVPFVADSLDVSIVHLLAPGLVSPAGLRALAAPDVLAFGVSVAMLKAAARWWLNGLAGVLLVVPALAPWTREVSRGLRLRAGEFLLWLLGLGGVVVLIMFAGETGWRLPVLTTGLGVVAWAAVRFGIAPASVATLLLVLAKAVGVALGFGGVGDYPAAVDSLWEFLFLLGAAAQGLTVLLADSDRADRELSRLDARYRALFDSAPHPVFAIAGALGRIRLANAAAVRSYGYDAAELQQMTLAGLDADRSAPGIVPAAETQSFVCRHRARSGQISDVELTVTPVEIDGEPGGSVLRDRRHRTQPSALADARGDRPRASHARAGVPRRSRAGAHGPAARPRAHPSQRAAGSAGGRGECAVPRGRRRGSARDLRPRTRGRVAAAADQRRPADGAARPAGPSAARRSRPADGADRPGGTHRAVARAARASLSDRPGGGHECAQARGLRAHRGRGRGAGGADRTRGRGRRRGLRARLPQWRTRSRLARPSGLGARRAARDLAA